MSRKQPVAQSVRHRVRLANPRGLSALPSGVPQMSPSQALAAIEEQVPGMTAGDCLEALAAVARLDAVLSARNVALATQDLARSHAASGPAEDLVDAKGAARRLGLSLPTVYRLARSGELPAVRIGDALRFDPEDIRALIAKAKPAADRP